MYVKSVSLSDLKGFKELNFSFVGSDGRYDGWTVIVGGNASGKSTLLKAIALALVGPDPGRQLLGNTVGWIREGASTAKAIVEVQADSKHDFFKKTGRITQSFQAGVEWKLESGDDTPRFDGIKFYTPGKKLIRSPDRGPWDPNSDGWFSAGYGPMRRLSGSSSESIRYSVGGGVVSQYVSLFREDAALSESEEWLHRMHSRTLEQDRPDHEDLELLVAGVAQLLSDELLPHGMRISRVTVDHVYVIDDSNTELPMREISDGCRGVYATVLDIVHSMYEVYGSNGLFEADEADHVKVTKPGVVLIDEVEAHLHPSWQQDIPSWLKEHFPRVQFIVATHSPLIAQSADPCRIFVLPLQNELGRGPRQLGEEEFRRVRWGSAHKTVLGVAFGLDSTRSKWADERIDQWERLEAKRRAGANLEDVPGSVESDGVGLGVS